jgi:hypothetical protein
VIEEGDSTWMVVTATTAAGQGALALAGSADGVHFVDQGPLLVGPAGAQLESPQLVTTGGRRFLLFSTGRPAATWVIEARHLRGPWDFASARRLLTTIAPEVWREGGELWVSSHDAYSRPDGSRAYLIGFDRLRVGAGGLERIAESGLGDDWVVVEGDAFTDQPTLGDNPAARGEAPVGLEGTGYLGTAERFTWPPRDPGAQRGDSATGRLRSRPFVLTGTAVTLRVGGTENPDSAYVAMRRADDGRLLFRETGRGAETMDERRWNTRALRGTAIVIEIADLDPHGHLNVDAIVEHGAAGDDRPPPDAP